MDILVEVESVAPLNDWEDAPVPEIQGRVRHLPGKSFDGGEAYLISFGLGVASGVVANWIYAQLVNHANREVRVAGEPVDLTADAIRRVVEEVMSRTGEQTPATKSDTQPIAAGDKDPSPVAAESSLPSIPPATPK